MEQDRKRIAQEIVSLRANYVNIATNPTPPNIDAHILLFQKLFEDIVETDKKYIDDV